MPGVLEVLSALRVPVALWANTRDANEGDVRERLRAIGLEQRFRWGVTSVEAGARKPSPQFFDFALRVCGLEKHEVLFVGNQLNTDIAGAQAYGIATVWVSGGEYRSADDDRSCGATPTYEILHLRDLPPLIRQIRDHRDGGALWDNRSCVAFSRWRWLARAGWRRKPKSQHQILN
jgi:FMN phosphatase YigB (HAD superfamily)